MTTEPTPEKQSRSDSRPGAIGRRLLVVLGVVVCGLAAIAVALAITGAWGARADVGTERPPAPTAAFRTIDGRDVTLAGVRGHPVALFFMASWCATCVPESQAWGTVSREATLDGLEVFVVSIDPSDGPQALAAYRDRYVGVGPHLVADDNQVLTRAFSVTALDTTVLIDGAGRIAYRSSTSLSADQLRTALEGL